MTVDNPYRANFVGTKKALSGTIEGLILDLCHEAYAHLIVILLRLCAFFPDIRLHVCIVCGFCLEGERTARSGC